LQIHTQQTYPEPEERVPTSQLGGTVLKKITEVQIRNYKSIAQAVVKLNGFTALVGPNGSGKSNFVDALAFVQQCLADSIELAFKSRGGIGAVRRRSGGC
jgi:predicted ATPase